MKLPNGYGSVIKLGGKRRKPYMVRKTLGWKYDPEKDRQVQDYAIIGYAKTKNEGLAMLSDYNRKPFDIEKRKLTFSEVADGFFRFKFGSVNNTSLYYTYHASYKLCVPLYDLVFSELRRDDLQDVFDSCDLGKSSQKHLKTFLNQMYKYALMEDICEKNYSQFTIPSGKDDEPGDPFSEEALRVIWEHKDESDAQIILMLVYSGLRISELRVVEIDLTGHTIRGGLKTKASKNRYAPIHEKTLHFWKHFDQASFSPHCFRERFYDFMEGIGFAVENGKKHSPHDCRHTFSWLADRSGMDDTCKHLLMGHKIPGDVEQTVYRHRTIDELRQAINQIEAP